MSRLNGNKFLLKAGTKSYLGQTDSDWSSSAKIEESLIKEDLGVPVKEIIGFEEKMTLSGIVGISETGEASTHTDYGQLVTAYKAKAAVAFVYGTGTVGLPQISGNMLILSMSQKAGASGKATYSMEVEIIQDASLVYGLTTA